MADRVPGQTDDTLTQQDFSNWNAVDNALDYVQSGLTLTADYATPAVDVSGGLARLQVSSTVGITADVDSRSGVSLADSATNYVYLQVDFTQDDSVSIVTNTTGSAPSGTTLLLGTVDTSADTTTATNRYPAVEARSLGGPLTGGQTISDLLGTNLSVNNGSLEATGAMASVSDDGTQVLASPSDLDFGTNITISDDGDGSVTIDVSDQAATDTRVDVLDDGTSIATDAASIDFGDFLSATGDGSGNITVNAASTAQPSTSEGGTEIVAQTGDINFDGNDFDVADDGDSTVTVSVTAAGGAEIQWQDDGTDVVQDASTIDLGSNASASYDSDTDTLTISADVGPILELVKRPNGGIDRTEVQAVANVSDPDDAIVDFGVPVPDGYTLEVYRWGCWRQDDTTPTGLEVVLLDESRTVQASANTDDSGNSTALEASLANGSGSLSHYYLGIQNSTGSDLLASNSEWVTGIFAYQVV